MKIIAPGSFGFLHIIVIVVVILMLLVLRLIFQRTGTRFIRYIIASFSGSILGILTAYLLSHVITPIVCGISIRSIFGVSGNYNFTFWSLFIGLSSIGIIAGGLIGIIYARKKEEGDVTDDR